MLKTKNKTKQLILKKSRIAFAQDGYAGTSIRTIAEASGITKPSIYYFFGNKEGLYKEVLQEIFGELDSTLSTELEKALQPEEKMYNMITTYLEYGIQYKNIGTIIVAPNVPASEKNILKFLNELYDIFVVKYFKNLMEEIKFPINMSDTDKKMTIYIFIKSLNGILLDNSLKQKWCVPKIARLITTIFFNKLKS